MEIVSQLWVYIVSAIGGVSLAGIISAIIYGCLKGAFNKTINKINVKKIADEATAKGVEKVKKISFTHTIQPLVESELQKINEKAIELVRAELVKTQENYLKVINILEKLAAYFDNSIGVPQTAKDELKTAINEAHTETPQAESVVIEDVSRETLEEPAQNEKQTAVER